MTSGATLETLAMPGEIAGNGQVETVGLVPSGTETRTVRRIAICGTAPSTRDQVPWNELDFEFWSLNDAWKIFPIKDGTVRGKPRMVWFDLHPRAWYTGPNRPPDHLEWLGKQTMPIYMWEHHEDIPASVVYPLEEMCRRFPGASARWDQVAQGDKLVPQLTRQHGYFTSSIAYMMALAISEMEPGDEIWFWGVDLQADTEYARQRPNMEYIMGVAQGRGIKIALPSACPVLQGPAYGRDDPKDQVHQMVRQRLEMVWQRVMMEKRQTEARAVFLQGKSQAFEEIRALWPER